MTHTLERIVRKTLEDARENGRNCMIEKKEIERVARVLCEANRLVPDAPIMLDGRPARLWEAYIDQAITDIKRRLVLGRVLNPQRKISLHNSQTYGMSKPEVSKRAIQLDNSQTYGMSEPKVSKRAIQLD